MDLALNATHHDEVTTLTVVGELDVATQPDLTAEFAALQAQGRDRIVLDLADLVFLDSTGIGALVTCAVEVRERGGWLRVSNVSGMPRRALEVTGVLGMLESGSLQQD